MTNIQDGALTIWRPIKYGGHYENIRHIPYRTKSYKPLTQKAQDNTYINIRAKTPIKSNLIYRCWFTENSETVLKGVIYGKPKQIKQTTQSYQEWVNLKVNSQLWSKQRWWPNPIWRKPTWRKFQYGGKSNMADILINKGNIDNFVSWHILTTQL